MCRAEHRAHGGPSSDSARLRTKVFSALVCPSRKCKVSSFSITVMIGTRERSASLVEVVWKVFVMKDKNVLGPDTCDQQHRTCLTRLLRWRNCWEPRSVAIELDAAMRYGDMLQAQLGLHSGSKGLSTPTVKEKVTTNSEVNPDTERAAEYR